jgi:hypothetical protein
MMKSMAEQKVELTKVEVWAKGPALLLCPHGHAPVASATEAEE